MKIDPTLLVTELSEMPALARTAEHRRRLSLGNSIAVAFSRSPAMLAYTLYKTIDFAPVR